MSERLLNRVIRIPGVLSLWRKFPVGTVPLRVRFGVWSRPEYAYGLFQAAQLAKALGLEGISAIECGVAGGNGLVALEALAHEVSAYCEIRIDVFGFDTGTGMPAPCDYRDLPHVWKQGFYKMNVSSLSSRLETAKLILGDVADTIPRFLSQPDLLPIGFVAFDLDYYSSTKKALRLLCDKPGTTLPRVFCYFDDVTYPEHAYHNDYVGELCAIREFNEEHDKQKLLCPHLFRNTQPYSASWQEQLYVFHNFEHQLYCVNVAPHRWGELPLT